MSQRTGWEYIKAAQADSQVRRGGYQKAGRAIRIAFEIRALREKKHLSQRELANRVGTTQPAIARLEAGNVSPSLSTLDKIADALGAEVSLQIIDLDELTTAS